MKAEATAMVAMARTLLAQPERRTAVGRQQERVDGDPDDQRKHAGESGYAVYDPLRRDGHPASNVSRTEIEKSGRFGESARAPDRNTPCSR